jgi:hypothetical protein
MNIRGLYSYLEFMEDMSDEYIQISIDTMIKKDKLNINGDKLIELKKLLNLLLENFGSINTKSFNGYSMLPKFSIVWNKYFLIGIVRSYFDEYFEVVNTDNMYNKTDYIIRRV